jgi:hypothetical protein
MIRRLSPLRMVIEIGFYAMRYSICFLQRISCILNS